MEFVENPDVDIENLLTLLCNINKIELQHACELHGEYITYNLQAVYLSAFMLKVLPLKPREEDYWSTLAETITGGILDSTFKNETINILKDTWNNYKKEVLQNLYRCMHMVYKNAVRISIQDLINSFSKHWLNLDLLKEYAVNAIQSNNSGLEQSGKWRINSAFDHKQSYRSSQTFKSNLTVEHLVMAMKKVRPYCPNKLSYWIALVKAADIEDCSRMTKTHAQDLQEFWYDNKELVSLLTGEILPYGSEESEKSVDGLNLMNVSDNSDDVETFSEESASVSTKEYVIKFQYTGRFEHHPFVEVCVADLLNAVGSTIPFTPSDQGFWCKIVRKITSNRRHNINFEHVATMLRCMWMLSMHGVSNVFLSDTQTIYESSIVEEIQSDHTSSNSSFEMQQNSNINLIPNLQFGDNTFSVQFPSLFCDVAFRIWKPHFHRVGVRKLTTKPTTSYVRNDCQQFRFYFDDFMWSKLKDCILKTNKFATQTWKRYMMSKLKQHNQYCALAFKSHWVCSKAYSKYIFFCNGYCKRSDCKLQFKVYVQNDILLSSLVTFYNVSQSSCKFSLLN